MHHNQDAGIVVRQSAEALIRCNEVYSNFGLGLIVGGHASPAVLCNYVHHNRDGGIAVAQYARGLVSGNEVSDNHGVGVQVSGSATPFVVHNMLVQNQFSGVLVGEHAAPRVVHNFVHARTGITLTQQASGTVTDNFLYGNQVCKLQMTAFASILCCCTFCFITEFDIFIHLRAPVATT